MGGSRSEPVRCGRASVDVVFHVKRVPSLPPDRAALLDRFVELLEERALPLGLVAPGDAGRVRERHVEDALCVLPCLRKGDRVLADLGSGAGLPGIPVAIARPDVRVVLIERMQRRAAFLELVIEHLALGNAEVRPCSIEEAARTGLRVDVCLARALAGPLETWGLAVALLAARGRLVYFAGASFDAAALGTGLLRWEICERARFHGRGALVIMQRAGAAIDGE